MRLGATRLGARAAPAVAAPNARMLGEINDYRGFQDVHTARDQNVLKFALMNVFQSWPYAGFNSWLEWISGSRVGILIALPR